MGQVADGKSARIGVLVPDANTTMENELRAWLPPGTQFRTLGMPRPRGLMTLADVPEEQAHALEMAQAFTDGSVDAVVFGCTAAGILAGPEGDARFTASLSGVTHLPAISTATSMVLALKSTHARTIALVTPYRDEVNEHLVAFLAREGITVQVLRGFGATSMAELVRIGPEAVVALAREAMNDACDTLFIACSQLPTFPVLPELEQEFGRPVWSSIKATAWNAIRTFGLQA